MGGNKKYNIKDGNIKGARMVGRPRKMEGLTLKWILTKEFIKIYDWSKITAFWGVKSCIW